MPLRFRVEVTRSTPRICVLRVKKINKGQEELETIGSFGQRKSSDLLLDKLTEDEKYELENVLSALEFSKKYFSKEADELDRFIIKVAPEFKEASYQLWKIAKKHDLEFIPEKEMLYGLLNAAKEIEKKIGKLTDKNVTILQKLGINPDEKSEISRTDIESKKLFKAMLNLPISIEKLKNEFQYIAQHTYHKNTRFEEHHFRYYADTTIDKPFPLWYYSVAIDLLLKHEANPIKIISPHKVAKHWARLKVNQMTVDKAKQLFIKLFNPPLESQKQCFDMINAIYLKNENKSAS